MMRSSRLEIHDSRFTLHGSRFAVHVSRFAVHGSRLAEREREEGGRPEKREKQIDRDRQTDRRRGEKGEMES